MTITSRTADDIRSMRDARRVFRQLPAPDPADLVGVWDGAFMGGRVLRGVSGALAIGGGTRGWCGKRIEPSGEVHNLVRHGTEVRDATRARLVSGRSHLDGQPAAVVDYSATAAPPGKWVRGELRWLVPGSEVLGVLLFPVGERSIGPFPFRLTRSL